MNSKLPLGWTTINLFDVCRPSQWKTLSLSELFPKGYLVYGANGPIGFFDKYTHEDPTVMITCRGATCGNVHVSKPQSYINGNAMALDDLVIELCHLKYLENFLRIRGFDDVVSGSAQPQITQNSLRVVSIPLAPAAEQTRIVEKLEELLSDLDAGVAELKAAQKKLAQYRQSLLKAAVEGALTADWRAARRENDEAETGAQLLARILTERRSRWETRQLAKFQAQGKAPPKDWQAKYPAPAAPDTDGLLELPPGWVWATVEQLGEVQLGRQRSPDKLTGINPAPYIRAANITEQGIDFSDVLEMDFTDRERETFQLKSGDVLLTEASGSPQHVGRPVIWPNVVGLYCFQNTVIRFSPLGIRSEFAFQLFLAWQKLGVFRRLSGGVGINHLSAGKFSALAVPLPPVAEQTELVCALSVAFESLALQEQTINYSLKQSSAQRKNILQAAFSGQLVPQDPADEPASVLLARIRAERAEQPKLRKSRQIREVL